MAFLHFNTYKSTFVYNFYCKHVIGIQHMISLLKKHNLKKKLVKKALPND
jgi:hypothetical protein